MKNNKDSFDEGEISNFNEAAFRMMRIHEEQREKNFAMKDLLGVHPIYGKYNYLLWADCLFILFREGYSKYSAQEHEEVNKLKEEIEEIIDNNHIIKVRKEGNKRIKTTNYEVWKVLKKKLEEFEYKVKLYNEKHGLGGENKEKLNSRSIYK